MSGLEGDEWGGERVPDERSGEQSQSDMPEVKGVDDLEQKETPRPADGEPTLPAGQEPAEN